MGVNGADSKSYYNIQIRICLESKLSEFAQIPDG